MLKHVYRDSDAQITQVNISVNAIVILLLLCVDHTHTYNNKDVPGICILWYDKDVKQPHLNVTLCEVWVSEWKAYCNGQTYAVLDKSPTMMWLATTKNTFGGAGSRFAKCMFCSQIIPIFPSGFHLLQEADVLSATGHRSWGFLWGSFWWRRSVLFSWWSPLCNMSLLHIIRLILCWSWTAWSS